MQSNQFSVSYNGHPVAITILDDDKYLVQVTYKPIVIQSQEINGRHQWVDVESQLETYVSREIGKLIEAHMTNEVGIQST